MSHYSVTVHNQHKQELKMKKALKIVTGMATTALILTTTGCSGGNTLEDRAIGFCEVQANSDYAGALEFRNPKGNASKSYNAVIKNTYDGDVSAWSEAMKQKDIKKGRAPKEGDFDCTIVEIKGTKGEAKQKVYLKKMYADKNHEMNMKRIDGKWYAVR